MANNISTSFFCYENFINITKSNIIDTIFSDRFHNKFFISPITKDNIMIFSPPLVFAFLAMIKKKIILQKICSNPRTKIITSNLFMISYLFCPKRKNYQIRQRGSLPTHRGLYIQSTHSHVESTKIRTNSKSEIPHSPHYKYLNPPPPPMRGVQPP